MHTLFRRIAFIPLLLLVAGPLVQSQEKRNDARLTLEDLVSVQPMGETALSPDGATLAFAREGQIVLMPAAGGWPEPLTSTTGGKTGIAWSPDGKRLAYASQGGIWVVPVAGGAPKRLTNAPPGAGDPRSATDRGPLWSPDGRWILFESGRRGGSSILVVSPDGNVTSFLTAPGVVSNDARWSPKGNSIAYIERSEQYFSGRVCVLDFDPASGQPKSSPRVLYTSPVDRGGGWSIRGVEWSPDGSQLATVLQTSGWDHIYSIPVAGGAPKQLTDGAFVDEFPRYSPDGKSIAFISSRGGILETTNLWIIPAAGGEARQAAKFDVPGVTTMPEWTPDSRQIFFHHANPRENNDLFLTNATAGGAPRQLTNTTLKIFTHAVMPELVSWKSKDGHDITGLLYLPPGEHPKGSLPLVEWVHGGPEGQDTFRGDEWAQYLAGAGYVVLEPNYRGSSGYGEVFRNLNVEDPGGGEVEDVAAGAKYLVARGLVDPKRMAIGGISHGATMTLYMLVRYPDLYAAAIEFAGVADRALFNERTNPNSAIRWQMKMGGPAAEKPEVYARANIIAQVDKIHTPLLAMHGENDPQVPPANAALMVAAMRAHHKTVFYFTYPNELHWVSTPQHKIDSWEKELAFLEHYINPKIGMTSTATGEIAFPKSTVVTGPSAEKETQEKR
jgi:dipeptidyl aminopeptidase/acylaminoacyl peptidase